MTHMELTTYHYTDLHKVAIPALCVDLACICWATKRGRSCMFIARKNGGLQTMTSVTHPWVVIHQENGEGPMQTVLAGPPGATCEHFTLCVADLVRHISRHFGESEQSIFDRIRQEIKSPTTDIQRITNS